MALNQSTSSASAAAALALAALAEAPSRPHSRVEIGAVMDSLARVRDHFAAQPIYKALDGRPNAYFGVTDFITPLNAGIIEDAADCCTVQEPVDTAELILSIADRSSGALAYSVSQRLGLPFTLANWYPIGSPGEVEVEKCGGFSGSGVIYVNGLRRHAPVLLVMDVLRSGTTALNLLRAAQKAGCIIAGAIFVCEIVEFEGRKKLADAGFSERIVSLVRVHMRAECTKEVRSDRQLPPTHRDALVRPMASQLALIKRMSSHEMQAKLERVKMPFLKIPIHRNPNLSYPYCFFQLTDFNPPLTADIVDDMADLAIYFGDFGRCDIIVSESDRGGGPLAQAAACRACKPYVMANWYSSGESVGAASHVQVGFSGEGSIVVNGIQPEMRCIFIDDMLSSGGTAEGVLRSIVQLGGVPIEGVFISEKLYPPKHPGGVPQRTGDARLRRVFPTLDITTLVQFVVDGERTSEPNGRVGDM